MGSDSSTPQELQKLDESVLIIDDEKSVCEFIEYTLNDSGFKASSVLSGVDAFQALEKGKFFLILCDIVMPEMDGLAFLKELKSRSITLPLIFLSGYVDKEIAIKALKLGSADILDKPIDQEKLLEIVRKYADARVKFVSNEKQLGDEILVTFIEEARELLSSMDEEILNIEKDPSNHALVNTIFRQAHTIKGSAGSVDSAEEIQQLAHGLENILKRIRDDGLIPTKTLISLMLNSVDLLSSQIDLLEREKNCQSTAENVTQLCKGMEECIKDAELVPLEDKKKETPTKITQTLKFQEEKDEGVFVSNNKLDTFMKRIGELVALRNSFESIKKTLGSGSKEKNQLASDFDTSLVKLSDHLQTEIMEIRKITLHKPFAKYQKTVRQLAIEMGKMIDFQMEGDYLSVDKNIAKALGNSLIHAVRNSCDHGIESPEERKANGKPEQATIKLKADQVGDTVQVILEDDGRGLDKEKIVERAVSRNLTSKEKITSLSDEEIYDFLFLPGFSTSQKVTNVSGRGVGMDMIKTAVVNSNGKLRISSVPSKSTTIHIQIPIPKTIVVEKSVTISTEGVKVLIPLTYIAEIGLLREKSPVKAGNIWTCQFQDRSIPLGNYRTFLTNKENDVSPKPKNEEDMVVILCYKDRFVALLAEDVSDQVEAVVRSFDEFVGQIEGFKGTTILSDGSIGYVISAENIIKSAFRNKHDSLGMAV